MLKAHEGIRCLFTTPKLLEALCEKASLKKLGITGIFCGGTEMTPQFHRFAIEELVEGAYFAPTYGNTLMGLAVHRPTGESEDYAIIYYPPAPRAIIEVVDPDQPDRVVGYGESGRVRLTTLTREFFMPGFLERDEGEREPPSEKYPWDGVRNVRPFQRFQGHGRGGCVLTCSTFPSSVRVVPTRACRSRASRIIAPQSLSSRSARASGGLIRRDLLQQGAMRAALAKYSCQELVAICHSAADHFLDGTLPIGDEAQAPEDYVRQTSATTGLPHVLVRRNMKKVHGVLAQVGTVLAGLTRGLDLGVLDRGEGVVDGRAVNFFPRGDTLGVVLPSNSPGVHSLWVPAVALKTALVLKPGSAEPWTPYRIIQALIRAGAPEDAFGFYPSDHASAAEILRGTGRGMLFGDTGTLKRWEKDPRIELHGPGYSKVVLGPDAAREWEKHLDVIVESILQNSGRSCVNASSVWVAGPAGCARRCPGRAARRGDSAQRR